MTGGWCEKEKEFTKIRTKFFSCQRLRHLIISGGVNFAPHFAVDAFPLTNLDLTFVDLIGHEQLTA